MPSDYFVVFSILQEPFQGYWVPLLFLFAAIGASGLRWWLDGALAKFATTAIALVFLSASVFYAFDSWQEFEGLKRAYRSGEYLVITGRVDDFRSDVPPPAGDESFRVGTHWFSFHRATATAAFHRTVRNGGPDLTGKCVKIYYTKQNEIIWLGINKHGCQ